MLDPHGNHEDKQDNGPKLASKICEADAFNPEGRYGLISSGLPGLTSLAVPSSFPKGTWTRRIFRPVKYAG
jgi:hypothetical protein